MESDTELCFSPGEKTLHFVLKKLYSNVVLFADFKRSPTMPLPQSLMSGFASPSELRGNLINLKHSTM